MTLFAFLRRTLGILILSSVSLSPVQAQELDCKVEFGYERGTILQHGNNYRSLESVIDFYVYVILGLDYDSYQKQSGTQYFQQAHETAVIASAAGGKGWDQSMSSMGTYSRLG